MDTTENTPVSSHGRVSIPKRIRDEPEIDADARPGLVLTDGGEVEDRRTEDALDRLRDVRERLAPLEVDLDDLRRRSASERGEGSIDIE